jgi:mannosyltransferase
MTRGERHVVLLLSGVLLLLLWLSRGRSSLWLDETATVWAVSGGLGDIVRRAMLLPHSVLYSGIIWAVTSAVGVDEFALRLPSLLAITGGAFILYRVGRDLFDRDTGCLAAVLFMAMWPVAFAAGDARPYALGLFMVIWSADRLRSWVTWPSPVRALVYAVTVILAVHLSYFLGLVFVAHALYLAIHWRRYRVPFGQLVGVIGLVSLGLLLLLPQLRSVLDGRASHDLEVPASWSSLAEILVPPRIALAIVAGVIGAYTVRRGVPQMRLPERDPALLFIVAWGVIPPVVMFLLSTFAGMHIFVQRYLIGAAPGIALLWAVTMRSVHPPNVRITVLLALGLITLVSDLRAGLLRSPDQWREAVAVVRSLRSEDVNLPVLVVSKFVEATWRPMPPRPEDVSWMVAPLSVYPLEGPVGIVPFRVNERNREYLEAVISDLEKDATRFVFVVLADDPVRAWLEARGNRTYEVREVGGTRNPVVLLFEPRAGWAGSGGVRSARKWEWERLVQ